LTCVGVAVPASHAAASDAMNAPVRKTSPKR
jgi:hypothetical protein